MDNVGNDRPPHYVASIKKFEGCAPTPDKTSREDGRLMAEGLAVLMEVEKLKPR